MVRLPFLLCWTRDKFSTEAAIETITLRFPSCPLSDVVDLEGNTWNESFAVRKKSPQKALTALN